MKLMGLLFFFILVSTLVLGIGLTGHPMAFRAPELLGDAPAYVLNFGNSMHGLILAPGGFLFTINGSIDGKDLSCQIEQIGGDHINLYEGPIPCHAVRRDGKWIGWIDFRGHERKFCGADSVARLPYNCMLGR